MFKLFTIKVYALSVHIGCGIVEFTFSIFP